MRVLEQDNSLFPNEISHFGSLSHIRIRNAISDNERTYYQTPSLINLLEISVPC